MKRLPLYPLLFLTLLAGGCVGPFKEASPLSPVQTVAALNVTYDSTIKTIERLHDAGVMMDEVRLGLQDEIDDAEKYRDEVNAAMLAGSKDEPFSDYRRAHEKFQEKMDVLVRAKLEAERVEKAKSAVKRTKAKPAPAPAPVDPTSPDFEPDPIPKGY